MALVETTDVRNFLSLAVDQDEDLLLSLIAAASAFVLKYIDVEGFEIKSYTQKYNGTGSNVLCPDNRPITAVASLAIDGIAVSASINCSDAGYVFDKYGIYLRSHRFCEGVMNVDVTYSAGYAVVPDDIKQAVIEIVAEKYQRRLRVGISSKTIGQESIAFSQNDLTPHARIVLNQYKGTFLTV